MDNISKLMFYFEPSQKNNSRVRSYTLSFSRIDKDNNVYRQKAILQYWSEKRNILEEYKMKEVHVGAKELYEKIKKIDFTKQYSSPKDNGDKLYICYEGKQLLIGDLQEVKDILEMFNFLDLYKISHKHYNYIKDMNEYIELKNILYKKAKELSIEEQTVLDNLFKENDPYKIFHNIPYLKNYLHNQEV